MMLFYFVSFIVAQYCYKVWKYLHAMDYQVSKVDMVDIVSKLKVRNCKFT